MFAGMQPTISNAVLCSTNTKHVDMQCNRMCRCRIGVLCITNTMVVSHFNMRWTHVVSYIQSLPFFQIFICVVSVVSVLCLMFVSGQCFVDTSMCWTLAIPLN